MADDNGKFWKEKFFYIVLLLLIGSFGWATFIGMAAGQGLSAQAKETKQDITDLRCEISAKLDKIIDVTTNIKTDIASARTQIEVNTKRLEKIESKI